VSSNAPASACPLCASDALALHHAQESRSVLKCGSCHLVFVDPLPSRTEKNEIERLAYEGDLLPETAEYFRNCHRNFAEDPVIRGFRETLALLAQSRKPGRILDVGPGTGIFLHLARQAGWVPRGIDVCSQSAEKALGEFHVPVDVGDFEVFPYEPESFDCITMLDVLEHAVNPLAFLSRAIELLVPGGLLYVAVPNQQSLMTAILDRYVQAGGPKGSYFLDRLYVQPHVFYFDSETLPRAVKKSGFHVVRVRTGNVYLGRYRIGWAIRAPMEIILRAGNLIGRGAKVHLLAKKP